MKLFTLQLRKHIRKLAYLPKKAFLNNIKFIRMHFGKIVKNVAYSYELSAEEFAEMLGHTETQLLYMYEQQEWTSSNIKAASIALDYDFGKYFNNGFQLDFMQNDENEKDELLITVRYSKGKEFLLQTWLDKIAQIAKAIGLQIGK